MLSSSFPGSFMLVIAASLLVALIVSAITVKLAHWSSGWFGTRKTKMWGFVAFTLTGALIPLFSALMMLSWLMFVLIGGLRAARVLSSKRDTPEAPETIGTYSTPMMDALGVLSAVFIAMTVAFAAIESTEFIWIFGHAILYLFPVLVPLYLAGIWLTVRLFVRMIKRSALNAA